MLYENLKIIRVGQGHHEMLIRALSLPRGALDEWLIKRRKQMKLVVAGVLISELQSEVDFS